MLVFSLKTVRHRMVMLCVCVLTALAVAAIMIVSSRDVPVDGRVSYRVTDDASRREFLASFGWSLAEDPLSVGEVVIPDEFDDVYTEYNKMQLSQGFDLSEYAGKTVWKWVYSVTNYPGYIDNGCIRATLLVYNDRVIGGDICSVEIDGFMHGFSRTG